MEKQNLISEIDKEIEIINDRLLYLQEKRHLLETLEVKNV